MRSKVKLSLIADETSRRTTFKKRKRGIMKKINELATLCDVKACAVVYSQNDSNPEAWPSIQGAQEVYSRFKELPMLQRTKKMVDQGGFAWERIRKGKEQVKKIRDENREFEIKEFMFDCLTGKKMVEHHYYHGRDIRDLRLCIDNYVKGLARRIEVLTVNGESSLAAVADADAAADGVADAVIAPAGFYDHIHQYHHNMNMQNQNQQEPVQYQAPENFYDHIQYQNMNQQEPVLYHQAPANFYDGNQHGFFGMSSNQIMNLDPNQQQPFMYQLMAHPGQMGYPEERASIPSMDGNYYPYQQLPTTAHMSSITTAATGHMPSITTLATGYMSSITTVATATAHMPSITTAVTGHMPSITTLATGYMPSITTASTGHMPSITTPATGYMPSITTPATGHMPSITTAATGHMPSITTPATGYMPSLTTASTAATTTRTAATTADPFALNTNNNLWPKRIGLE